MTYDPNQPRDEEGQWTEAGNATRKAAGLKSFTEVAQSLEEKVDSGSPLDMGEITSLMTLASSDQEDQGLLTRIMNKHLKLSKPKSSIDRAITDLATASKRQRGNGISAAKAMKRK
jgi:hypothetical protein